MRRSVLIGIVVCLAGSTILARGEATGSGRASVAAEEARLEAVRRQRTCAAIDRKTQNAFDRFGDGLPVFQGGLIIVGGGLSDGGKGVRELFDGWGVGDVPLHECGGGRFVLFAAGLKGDAQGTAQESVRKLGLAIAETIYLSPVDAHDWLEARGGESGRIQRVLETVSHRLLCEQAYAWFKRYETKWTPTSQAQMEVCAGVPHADLRCLTGMTNTDEKACGELLRKRLKIRKGR